MGGVLPYLIICPLVGIAGFVDAIAGGGGLISLPAYLIAGVPVHTAIGTNKLSSSMGTAVSTFRYAREGFIPWRQSLLCVVFALAGSAAGARLTLLIPERGFTLAMLVVLPLTAWYVLRSSGLQVEKAPFPFRKTLGHLPPHCPAGGGLRRLLRAGYRYLPPAPLHRRGPHEPPRRPLGSPRSST